MSKCFLRFELRWYHFRSPYCFTQKREARIKPFDRNDYTQTCKVNLELISPTEFSISFRLDNV